MRVPQQEPSALRSCTNTILEHHEEVILITTKGKHSPFKSRAFMYWYKLTHG